MCVCVFLDLSPQVILLRIKSLRLKKQNEAELKSGRVYYEKIKDRTRLSLPMVFLFFCLAQVVSVFPLCLFRLNIAVPIHLPIFSDSSANCLGGST